jgi:hypothetical protein
VNNYYKFAPNVFLAKCTESHNKGDVIPVETRYGKENNSIVFNFIGKSKDDNFFYYSIVREDGFNVQEYAKRKAEKLQNAASNAEKKSDSYYQASNEGKEFLSLGEPIKIGHHSESRHRKLIERNFNRMGKSVEMSKKAETYENRAEYWEAKTNTINLSMPESIEFYEFKLEQAVEKHVGIKNGSIPREHAYSLTYAKKEVNEFEKKVKMAIKLWGEA